MTDTSKKDGVASARADGIDTTYLLKFKDVVFAGGAVQYQQLVNGEQWPGFYEFLWCSSEDSATPLLDVQVATDGVKMTSGCFAPLLSGISRS
jgi:hypothetical protein